MADVKIIISADASGVEAGTNQAAAALGKVATAGKVSAGQTAQAFRQLPAQFTDIATQLAGGQSIGLVLLQQGGQIKDSFGGIGAAAQALSSVFTPLRLVLGGVAAAAAAVALAAYEGRAESDALAKSLLLTGNYAGITAGAFTGLAEQVQSASGATIGASREMLAGAVASGAFGQQSVGVVATAMARLQSISGESSATVLADFAGMSKGVAVWAAEHNRQYSFLTAAQYEHIKALEQQGKTEQAMAETGGLLDKALKDREPALGSLQKMWKSLGNTASEAWDAMKGIGRAETLDEQLAKVQRRLKELPISAAGGKRLATIAAEREVLQSQADALQVAIDAASKAAASKAAAAAKERTKIAESASGKTDAMANAGVDLKLANARTASAAVLAGLDLDQQRTEAAYKLGLTTAQAYAAAKIALIRKETQEHEAEVGREIALEKTRPAAKGTPAEITQQAKLAELRGKLEAARMAGAKQVAAVVIEADVRVLDNARAKAAEWGAAWLAAHNQVRDLARRNADAQIALIRNPQDQVRAQTAEQIKRLTEDADATTLPWRVAVATTANPEQRAALQKQIDDFMAGTSAAQALANDALAEKLKPTWEKTLDGWRDNNRLMAESWNSMMDGVLKNGEDAFVQFATTGKLSIKGLVDGMLAEMARAQFRQFIGSLGGGGGSWLGSLGGALGSLLGLGGGNPILKSPNTNFDISQLDGISGLATGGAAAAGSLHWVGERGPELLRMGSQGGSVIPNHAIAAASGGGAVSLSMPTTIQIDARSDQGQIAQLVGGAIAESQRNMMAALRARGIA